MHAYCCRAGISDSRAQALREFKSVSEVSVSAAITKADLSPFTDVLLSTKAFSRLPTALLAGVQARQPCGRKPSVPELMSGQPCDTRAFFIIDALSPGSLVWARKALLQLGNLLCLGLKAPPPLGLAIMKRMGAKQSSQCNILLRPGASFQLKEYGSTMKRITAAAPEDAADGNMLAGAIMALLQHMMKQPGGEVCHNHIFILSSRLASSPRLQQVMQYVRQSRSSLHFLQLTGPEAEMDCDTVSSSLNDQTSTMQLPKTDDAGQAAEFEQVVAPFAPHATYDAFTTDCPEVSDLLCQCWIRELMTNSTSKNLTEPDLILQLGQHQLPCHLQQHILQLEPWVLPAHLCPCHNQPLQPPTGSAAALQAAAAAATDPASAAGLLLLPSQVPWRCSVSGNLVLQALTSCRVDPNMVQLGRHTHLKLGLAKAVAPGPAGTAQGCCGDLPAALMLSPGQSCRLEVKHVVGLDKIDSMMLYGMPMIVTPAAHMAARIPSTDPAEGGATTFAEDSSMFMRAICQLLLEHQQVLLASSNHDLVRRYQQPLQQWYMLQPSADGCSLLLRYMASKEQLMPPRGFNSMVGIDSDVVLLDADQLAAARTTLAGLELGAADSGRAAPLQDHPSAKLPVQELDSGAAAAAATVELGQPADAELAGVVVQVREVAEAAAHQHDDSSTRSDREGPLLLSCGLHEWMQTIIDSSTATHQAPPQVPAAPAATLAQNHQLHTTQQVLQQQQQHQPMQQQGAVGGTATAAAVLSYVAPAAAAVQGGPAAAARLNPMPEAYGHAGQQPPNHWQGNGPNGPQPPTCQHHQQVQMQANYTDGSNVQSAAGMVTRQSVAARHGVTTAAQMLQGLHTAQHSNGFQVAGAGVSGRGGGRRGRGTARNALKLSSTAGGR